MAAEISVTLAWSSPNGSIYINDIKLPIGSTVQIALAVAHEAGLELPVDWQSCKLGIYGKLKTRDAVLRDKDRIELHRTLIADPKEARRLRAHRHPIKRGKKSLGEGA